MVFYKDIIFFNGIFYTDKVNIEISYTHNRLKENKYLFSPSDISTLELTETPLEFNTGIILLDHFHFNPAHNMWDHLYPSWYGIFKYLNDYLNLINFQYITNIPMDNIFGVQHINLIEKFSGNKPLNLNEFTNKFNKPIIIPWLITGLEGIGISHIFKENLLTNRGVEINNIDPIELFVNRIYSRYNIKRNSLIDKLNINECNNIIFIKNKRPYNGIEKLFKKMNDKYKGKYNFKIIDYSKYNFEQQLYILNTTCLCIVGVGSARFNTPFLPNGAIEIQIFQPNIHKTNNIKYLDYHAGTLSKYVKIKNIPYYTKEEANNNLYSHLLENYIDDSLIEISCIVPINLEENIPVLIRNLKYHKNYNEKFDIWRNNNSNIVEDLINLL
jgi:hypothetical protein